MSTLYDLLEIHTSASTAEVELAIDTQYNKWRKLTTHHDPAIAQKATSQLTLLEEARSTLLIANKRAAYDAGLDTMSGGLADPNAVNVSAGMGIPTNTPARSISNNVPQKSLERVDAWICEKCDKANPIGVQHCSGCGATIGILCPNCNIPNEKRQKFCMGCGTNIKEAIEQLMLEESQHQFSILETRLSHYQSQLDDAQKAYDKSFWTPGQAKQHVALGGTQFVGVFIWIVILLLAVMLAGNSNDFQVGMGLCFGLSLVGLPISAFLANGPIRSKVRAAKAEEMTSLRESIARVEAEMQAIAAAIGEE